MEDATTGAVLEQAILDDPDDLAAYHAYADWLMEQNDPRGIFMQVQLALEDEKRPPEERKELQAREKELLDQFQEQWLGASAEFFVHQKGLEEWARQNEDFQFQCRFRRGLPFEIRFDVLNADLAHRLGSCPELRFVQRLIMNNGLPYEDERSRQPPAGVDIPPGQTVEYGLLGQASFLPRLRSFQLGEDYEDGEYSGSNCHAYGDRVVDLLKQMPKLEELRIMAHNVDTAAIFQLSNLTSLRLLEVDHVYDYPLPLLAANPAFANLTELRLHPHAFEFDDENAYITLDDIRAIARSPHLQNLQRVRICLTDAGNDGVREIIESGMLARLKLLDLSHGRITDEGARLLASAPATKNLEFLNLNYNALTATGVQALEAVGVPFSAKDQYPEEAIEEGEYLYGGDIE